MINPNDKRRGQPSVAWIPLAVAVLLLATALSGAAQPSVEPFGGGLDPVAQHMARGPDARSTLKAVQAVEDAGNYAFSTSISGSLTDMSAGTTELLGGDVNDAPSALTDIGFDFYFQSQRYTQFSVSTNGGLRLGGVMLSSLFQPLGQPGLPVITAFGSNQRTHAGDGKVHYKVTGAAPNRVLSVEWRNNQSTSNPVGTADLTYQVRLHETTGVIELVYGTMTMSPLSTIIGGASFAHIGFSSGNTVGTVGSVSAPQSGMPAPSFNSGSATAAINSYAPGPITALTSAAQGARRTFTFTPTIPTAPTALTFSNVTQFGMTLNWADAPDEQLYAIYRSTDAVNFTFEATAAQNSTSHAASVLPGINYSWRVFAVSEGALSAALAGSRAAGAAGTISSTAAGGNWSSVSTWVGGAIPGPGDNVTIVPNSTVTIDVAAFALSITVQNPAILQFEPTTARTLTVTQSVTINQGGQLRSALSGLQAGHVISIGGNLTNNGILNLKTTAGSPAAGAGLVFTGSANAAFLMGTNSITQLKFPNGLLLDKGTSETSVLTFTPSSNNAGFSVAGVNTQGFLTIFNGTFKLSGFNNFSNPLFSSASYVIPPNGGLWIDNPSATIPAQNGSPVVAGLFRMTAGTFNIGTVADDSMGFAIGADIRIEGGTIRSAGRFGVAAENNAITYNQTGGTVTVSTAGNSSTTLASFDLGSASGSMVKITGGSITVQHAGTGGSGPRDYRHRSGATGTASVTSGTVQFGNSNSGAAQQFVAWGVLPDVVVSNASGGHTLALAAAPTTRNLTVNSGTTVDIGVGTSFVMNGATLVNNGTLIANNAASFTWSLATSPQSYSGTGVFDGPVGVMNIQAPMGVVIDPASSNISVATLRMFVGNVINANRITLANGGMVEFGNASIPLPAGSLDVPFTYNSAVVGYAVRYLSTTSSRTTGNEITAGRTLSQLTYSDPDPAHTLTIAGGDLTLTSTGQALSLTNGRIVTGANTLILSAPAAQTIRVAGWVDGNLRKSFGSAGTKQFEVGTANGYSPVTVQATGGVMPAVVTIKAVQGPHPNAPSPTTSLQRYWTLGATDLTANLTFNYLDVDVPATTPESALALFKYGGTWTMPGGTVNTGANTVAITGVSSFSDWTLAAPLNLSIAKAHVGQSFTQGQAAAQYTLTVTNGPVPVPDGTTISVTDTLPADLTYVGGSGAGWSCSAVGQVVTCTITQTAGSPFGANASAPITLTVNVAAGAGASITNTATCNCSATAAANNTASDTVTVVALAPDLVVTKTHAGNFAQGQTGAAYAVNVTNNGTAAVPAGAVQTLTEQPPAGLAITAMSGSGWTCELAPVAKCTRSDALAAGQSYPPISVKASVAANAASPQNNTVTIATTAAEVNVSNNSATDSATIAPPLALTVTKAGSGSGTVAATDASIDCGAVCSNNYAAGTVVQLNAAPAAGSVFTGWLGACTGIGACTLTFNQARSVSATFAPSSIGNRILDVDANNAYEAATDGLLVVRYLFGLTGAPLTAGALGANPMRTDPAVIASYLDDVRPRLDIDGDGVVDALTDGLLIMRRLFGATGQVLIKGLIAPNASRVTPGDVETYLSTLRP